ncbi:MAG TPA: M20/M25/M40 family metallo-hydrolase [Candidatus Saccharimonadales bacterium]|nr:M20/M25/M40 family metallo-hydrolase [Candidatus Saccharimonadales bacterium]
MHKKIRQLSTYDFTNFAGKITAKWQSRTQQNIPAKAEKGKSTEDILADLVAMPTITGNYETNHEALDYIDRFLKEYDLHVKRYEWNGIESLVATTRRTKTPTVCLFGHIDVVSGPNELFQLKTSAGKYYGRGVLDMKGAIAAFIGTVQELAEEIKDYDFAIALTSDEEVGGLDGAAKLAEEGFLPKMIVVPDGGDNWNLERFAKGIWHITVEVAGKAAHGSRPWEGENAIEKLICVLADIRDLFPEEMNSETSTINVGIVQGGGAINQIPGAASASIDMRFASAEEQMRIVNQIESLIERAGDIKITTEVKADTMVNDPENPFLAAYAKCTEEVIGRPIKWTTSNAGNDGRFFSKHGIPCAIGYPPGANHHGPNEYIEKESLLQMQRIFVNYIRTVAKNKRK